MKVHGDRYDYGRTRYLGARQVVEVRCWGHGQFKQPAFVNLKHACPSCGIVTRAETRRGRGGYAKEARPR